MKPQERIDYSPINERPPLKLPDGARLAIWVIVNVEEWDIQQTMPRSVLPPPAGSAALPDIPNWAWHEYGNRVGFWRMLEVLDRFEIRAVLAVNGRAVRTYAPIARAARERKWEFMGHGFTQQNMQKVENESEVIAKTTKALAEAAGGKRPLGWLGPGLTETWETPDLLIEHGYQYVADWVLDDQPVLKTRTKPLVSIPYTQEINDVPMMLIQHHPASEYFQRATDQFEQLYHDAEGSARVMALVLHPYIMGTPHRLKYLRMVFERIREQSDVLFWTGEQILEWYLKERPLL